VLKRALSVLSVLVVMAGPVTSIEAGDANSGAALSDAKSRGNSSAGLVKGRYGSAKALNQNLNVPMTNNATQMNTLDGSKAFNAALSAPSSAKFLEIFIQPSGSGDLSVVKVSQDLNSDNQVDHVFNVGTPVSGVCSNGFISCSPGTWGNCQAKGWLSDDAGKLSVVNVPITQLSGCFCINSSCGSNLVWTNASVVLKALGGGQSLLSMPRTQQLRSAM